MPFIRLPLPRNVTSLAAILPPLLLIFAQTYTPRLAAAEPLPPPAAALLAQAQSEGRFYSTAVALRPELYPTSDNRSFSVIWLGSSHPTHWIVSLHGAGHPARGFATDELAVWQRHLAGLPIGIICIQWWLGSGDRMSDFYSPDAFYQEATRALLHVGATPGKVLLHGFSRGSTNTFAVAAIDNTSGRHYFSRIIASSGGYADDYPPNRIFHDRSRGPAPLGGTKWYTAAGGQDPSPDRDGIPGMQRTAEWLQQQGATVLERLEFTNRGHGALMFDSSALKRILDEFIRSSS